MNIIPQALHSYLNLWWKNGLRIEFNQPLMFNGKRIIIDNKTFKCVCKYILKNIMQLFF